MKRSIAAGTILAAIIAINADTSLSIAANASQMIPRYAKFEASFRLADTMGNPFDPSENDVQAIFTGPDGKAVMAPAFWDGGVWKVRYAPTRVGRYRFRIIRNGRPEQPPEIGNASFVCTASADPGFVRIDHRSSQAFAFDNGSRYYPIGCDEGWSPENDRDYATAFGHMRDAGMNWARIWMTAWDKKNLEWGPAPDQSPPLGQYLLDVAQQWDRILDNAAADGVYLQITMQHHGQVTRVVNPDWDRNPYNVANGGFLKNPDEYFTNPRAIALTKAKYRYIVARWGYSDHILSWELFNEIQNDPESNAHFDTVIAWHRTMAAYLRSLDPNRHLVTSSNTEPGNDLEAGVDFDYDQKHAYPADIIGLFGSIDPAAGERPWFYGEWGPLSGNWNDKTGMAAFLHDGLWSGMMVPTAGAQQYWHWEHIVENDWWPIYRSATDYVKRSGMASAGGVKRLAPGVSCSAKADLVFAPQDGWQPSTTFDVALPADGSLPKLKGVSEFIQGSNHREMMPRPITFHVRCAQPSRFVLRIADIAAGGAHPQILLDGQPKADRDFPGTGADRGAVGETLAIDVPAGPHTIGLFNTDRDWYTVESLTLTDYVPALGVTAKGNARTAFFWAYNRVRPYHLMSRAKPISGAATFSGLRAGTYRVSFWNTTSGKAEGAPLMVKAKGGTVTIPLRLQEADIAGYLSPAPAE
jgi:hypothetical protein